jgi:hypothetical protein
MSIHQAKERSFSRVGGTTGGRYVCAIRNLSSPRVARINAQRQSFWQMKWLNSPKYRQTLRKPYGSRAQNHPSFAIRHAESHLTRGNYFDT